MFKPGWIVEDRTTGATTFARVVIGEGAERTESVQYMEAEARRQGDAKNPVMQEIRKEENSGNAGGSGDAGRGAAPAGPGVPRSPGPMSGNPRYAPPPGVAGMASKSSPLHRQAPPGKGSVGKRSGGDRNGSGHNRNKSATGRDAGPGRRALPAGPGATRSPGPMSGNPRYAPPPSVAGMASKSSPLNRPPQTPPPVAPGKGGSKRSGGGRNGSGHNRNKSATGGKGSISKRGGGNSKLAGERAGNAVAKHTKSKSRDERGERNGSKRRAPR